MPGSLAAQIDSWVAATLAGSPAGAQPFRGSIELTREPEETILWAQDTQPRRKNGAIVGALGLVPAAIAFFSGVRIELVAPMAFVALLVVYFGWRRYRAAFGLRLEPNQVVVIPSLLKPYSVDPFAIVSVFLEHAGNIPETQPVASSGLVLGFRTTSKKHFAIQADVADPRLGYAMLRLVEGVLGVAPAPAPTALGWRPSTVPWAATAFVVIGLSALAGFSWFVGAPLAEMVVGNEKRTTTFSMSERGIVELRSTVYYGMFVERDEIQPELRYDIVVSRGSLEVADIECDPFASKVWLWSSGDREAGKTRVFNVVLPGCNLDLEPGVYTIEACRVWTAPEASSKISETAISVVEPSLLSSLAAKFR